MPATYPARLLGRWTHGLAYLPRWLDSNGYPTMGDPLTYPGDTAWVGPTPAISLPNNGKIPFEWVQTSNPPDTSGRVLESILEAVAAESLHIQNAIVATSFSQSLAFDTAEPDYGWLVEVSKVASIVEIQLTDDTWHEIPYADSELALFWSGGWGWRQETGSILIAGLETVPQTTNSRSTEWQFIGRQDLWEATAPLFLEHPDSKNWLPLHPAYIRSDGFLGYLYSGTISLRSRLSDVIKWMETVNVRIDGLELTARRVSLSNTLDDVGLWCRQARRDGESNSLYGEYLLWSQWFAGGTSRQFLKNQLSIALRTASTMTISAGDTEFDLAPGATGYSIRDREQFSYVLETNLTPDGDQLFRSVLADPTNGAAIYRGRPVAVTAQGSGLFSLDTDTVSNADRPDVYWVLDFWSENNRHIAFTENMDNGTDELFVLVTSKVDADLASEAGFKKSFASKGNMLKWKFSLAETVPTDRIVRGLALFY